MLGLQEDRIILEIVAGSNFFEDSQEKVIQARNIPAFNELSQRDHEAFFPTGYEVNESILEVICLLCFLVGFFRVVLA